MVSFLKISYSSCVMLNYLEYYFLKEELVVMKKLSVSKYWTILFLVLVFCLIFTISFNVFAETKYKMVSIPKLRSIWFNDLEKGVLKAGEDLNVDAFQQAPASADEAEQIRLIEDAINQQVDAILVVPNNGVACEPVFQRAKEEGIVVITHESPDQKYADYDVEMIDNTLWGTMQLDQLAELMGGKGKYALYVGSLTVLLHNFWADAAIKYQKEKYPEMELVADRFPVAEDMNLARQTALDIIATYPDLKGFLAFGSQGPLGAAQAIREKNLIGEVFAVGSSTPMQAAQYIEDSSLGGSVVFLPSEAGYMMVYLAKMILDGKQNEIVDGMETPFGKPKVDGINVLYHRPIILTKDNVNDFEF
jgi:simple sugar transport system substrate-binding protein